MQDLNEYLLQTKTATEDGGQASEQWIRRRGKKTARQRIGGDEEAGASATSGGKQARHEPPVGLDLAQLQEELAKSQQAATARLQRSTSSATELVAQEAAQMAQLVLQYVFVSELGGRHNAARGGAAVALVPPAAQIHAERAWLVPAAFCAIHHVLDRTSVIDGAPPRSTVHRQPLPDDMVAYRQSLRVCDLERDLVGGVTAGAAEGGASGPNVRRHLQQLLLAALRGEDWIAGAQASGTTEVSEAQEQQEQPASIALFAKADDGAADAASGQATFSLDAFLHHSSDSE